MVHLISPVLVFFFKSVEGLMSLPMKAIGAAPGKQRSPIGEPLEILNENSLIKPVIRVDYLNTALFSLCFR